MYAAERQRKGAEQKAKAQVRKKREEAIAREKYLNDLAKRENKIWRAMETLIQTQRPSDYDKAVTLLVDLRDLNEKRDTEKIFEEKFRSVYEQHRRKSSLIRRFIEAGLDGHERMEI